MNEENSSLPQDTQTESSSGGMMKMLMFAVPVILILLAIAGYFVYANMKSGSSAITETSMPTPNEDSKMMENTNEDVMGTDSEVKTFTVTADNFYFEPKLIEVNEGNTVKIVLSNLEGTHDWRLDEFNAKTEVIQTGQATEITFVADKSGSYEFYCSIGSHRQMGMVGTLTVN